ncbi:porin [Colwellia sp. E2M01]|uniref:porin n=1 Tax=Colwellia sp. E2M01 TaxID=2841561 RepID=UPI001C09DCAD|nr:porin [Colwellia sp. E2M01]MBU2872258.1 porin [Colwellia sp. E2M01]
MKFLTKLTPVAATLFLSLGALSAQAEEVKDPLSISGFVDMSYYSSDLDGADPSMGLDQAEIDLAYDFGNKLSVNVDIEYQSSDANADGVDLEQAYMTYAYTDNISVKAGRFLSYSGFEAEEPTGLYQYSGTGYAKYFYGYYQQGVSGMYSADKFAVAVSVVNSLAGPQDFNADSPAIETMFAFMPTEAITLKAFYSMDETATGQDIDMINLWGSYAAGPLTIGLEYNMADNTAGDDTEASGYLAMVNYAFTDKVGLTLRYNAWEVENSLTGAATEESSGITISPSYVVNDNLLMVFEYRMDSNEGTAGADANSFAVEALVTF